MAKSMTANQVYREIGIGAQTFSRWRKEYGEMKTSQARRLKKFERKNSRLKKLAAERALELEILKEVTPTQIYEPAKETQTYFLYQEDIQRF